ncbi:isocitrate lyase/PEP mutase family protein [Candidimonas nitroreducens]|uniref:Carboxyvinyl-carboxyphosphonate phosphorylmutase n=1 Tax=Candidimonas nitroreducens TaxID=683354 RepID=A0A225LWS6_9BURK|nr:isocitrate lyase/PEP mutase family protein [Candidimonas nitroreducens]OWT53725.1 carboxyvinyl-carboxyphosphonate phosphorylmutase [Candidimonas nitroreducens]
MESKGKRLKDLLHAPKILIAPGVFDGFSARLVEQLGFVAGAITGSGVSEAKMGWPDRGIIGYAENVDASRQMASYSSLLLQADADTGYGNELNVYFTVRGFEDAGLAAVMIEDQVWPKRCGHMAGKSVIGADDMVRKIKAAVSAKRDPDFVIKARTDAAGPLGIEEAIRRLNMYAEAGADCLFADALLSAKDIEHVAKHVPAYTLSVNMGLGIRSRKTTPLLTPKQLEEMGVAQVSYPRMLTTAALKGMQNAMKVFMDEVVGKNTVVDRPDLLVSFEELNELMGLGLLDGLERKFNA